MDEMITVAGVLPTTYLFIISVRREPSPCCPQTPDCPGPGADKVHSCRETVAQEHPWPRSQNRICDPRMEDGMDYELL